MVRSRKFTEVVELVEEKVMLGWNLLNASMKLFSACELWIHMINMSSIYPTWLV